MIEPARAAFLLIDMQNGFIDGASPLCIAGAAATVPACAHALAAAHEHGLAVFHVRRAYAADGAMWRPSAGKRGQKGAGRFPAPIR